MEQKARRLNIAIDPDAATEIAGRSRMTARVAVRILKRARDLAVVSGLQKINREIASTVLNMLSIDEMGLDTTDMKILNSLYATFAGRPVGLGTLAASISEESSTVEDVYEPFLLRCGMIERTPRGRMITLKAIEYINRNL